MIENKSKSFTNNLIFFQGSWSNGRRSWYVWKEVGTIGKLSFLYSVVVFNVMKLLPKLQVKAGKTMINESYRTRYSPTG